MINIAVSAQRVFIEAEVPKRLEWKLIPDAVITRLVEDVVQHRLNEITDTFIARSIDGLRP
jgi:LytS/YehU family sensor histidine kinase